MNIRQLLVCLFCIYLTLCFLVNREYGKGRYWISDDGLHILYLRDPEDSGEYICRAKDLITGVVEEKKITVIISSKCHNHEKW